jgi:Holliday junction resolvase RusA-like endonuclease
MKTKISGVPYGKAKVRGRIEGCQEWTDAIIAQTRGCEPVHGPCRLDVEFLLPPDKYPADLPEGPDLDNLLKRLLDALQETVLRGPGRDSSVVDVHATKTRVASDREAGANLTIELL